MPPPDPDRSRPVINTIPADQTLSGGNTATLTVENIGDADGDAIMRVWAEIIAPDYNPDPDGQTVTSLPTVELLDPEPDGLYEGDYFLNWLKVIAMKTKNGQLMTVFFMLLNKNINSLKSA